MSPRVPRPGKPKPLAVLLLTLLLLCVAMAFALRGLGARSPGIEIGIDQIQRLANSGAVVTARVFDQDARVVVQAKDGRTLWAAFPSGGESAMVATLVKAGARVGIEQQWGKRTLAIVTQFLLPLLLLANLFGIFILLSRSGGGQIKELFAFSRIGKRKTDHSAPGAGFSMVAALPEATQELAEVRDYLQNPSRFAAMGATPPKGVLLYGPPGCGKTLLARSLASEVGVPFFFFSGSEFVESLVGIGAARVRDLFVQAKAAAPAIVFVDELDAAGRRRGAGLGGGNDEREQTLNELLVQMDGFEASTGVVVIGATNRPDILDPALTRPGRFDRHIGITVPDVAGRIEILQLHAAGRPLDPATSLAVIAKETPGFTGADLASVINEGALLAVRQNATVISQANLSEAVQRVQFGPRTRGRLMTADELTRLAIHEAGHVIVARGIENPPSLGRVTIVARGRDAAHCDISRGDRVVLTEPELLDELTTLLGGLAAEQLATGSISTAVEGDLERATELAREVAGRFGMSEKVGRMRVLAKDAEVFLGRDYMSGHTASTSTMQLVDEAVRDIIGRAEAAARAIVQRNLTGLEVLKDALLEAETLTGEEVERLLGDIRPVARARVSTARRAR